MRIIKYKPIYKSLIGKQNNISILGALFGLFIGLLLLLTALQIYLDFSKTFIKDEGLINNDYLVINKKISLINTFITETGFTQTEIDKIKENPFIDELGLFVPNMFKVSAYTKASNDIPAFYTELFFEGVETKFLDVDTNNWKWNDKSDVVPIIIPRNYLKLYNFGFAQSQNLPKITESLIENFNFDLKIEGKNENFKIKAKIYGFTDRINSIIVPMDFIEYGNKNYAIKNTKSKAGRLILKVKNGKSEQLLKFLNENNYETSEKKIKNSKLVFAAKAFFYLAAFISIVIVLLSFIIFILSFNLLALKSSNSIKNLLNLGYYQKQISYLYFTYYTIIVIPVVIINLAFLHFIKLFYAQYFKDYGFTFEGGIHNKVILLAVIITLIALAINYLSIKNQIKKINNSNF